MRCVAQLTLPLLAACASGTSAGTASGAPPAPQSVAVPGSNARFTIVPTSNPFLQRVDASVEQVWEVLPAAFHAVSVPVVTMDPTTRIIGNNALKIRQRLGKVALSRYIDCGETQIGPNADSYEVILTLVVQLRPAAASTSEMTMTMEAAARPIAFSQAYARCTSRGTLEKSLADAVAALLKR